MSSFALGGLSRDTTRELRLNVWLILSTLILLMFGFMSLYSICYAHPDFDFFRKQGINLALGAVPFATFFFTPTKFWRRNAAFLYIFSLVCLIAVLTIGKTINGSARWLDFKFLTFQPSEMSKLFTVLTVSSFFALRQDKIRSFPTLLASLLHVAIPMALIMKQPAYGAALVLLVIWASIALAAGASLRHLAIIGAFGAVMILPVLVLKPNLLLTPYQLERLEAMVHKQKTYNAPLGKLTPAERSEAEKDRDRRYQINLSEMAFGSGGVMGQGYLHGVRTQAGIPMQEDDFVFTVIGEEGGLIGATLCLAAFGFFFYRLWLTMVSAVEIEDRMIVAGVLGMLAFHMAINLLMIMGLIPVMGLWLPFMSYGGNALWLCLACVALVLNIDRRRSATMF